MRFDKPTILTDKIGDILNWAQHDGRKRSVLAKLKEKSFMSASQTPQIRKAAIKLRFHVFTTNFRH
jgi:hypothetical protein